MNLRGCQGGHTVAFMTSAYEGGTVPTIEVRHRLRIAREFAQLEQEELAELIGVSRTTVSNNEKGRVYPRRILLNAWALACGVPASWLWTGNHPDGGDGPGSGLGIKCPQPIPPDSKDRRSNGLRGVA